MITRFKLTAKSSNRKTGPIATTMSSSDTCPTTCPFNNGKGCYAASGPTAIHWGKLDRGETGSDWLGLQDQLAAAKLKPGTLLRHNVAGDLPHNDGLINSETLRYLTTIFLSAGVVPYTYTHHAQTEINLGAVKSATAAGFTINLSCDTEAQAAKRHSEGFSAVVVVPKDDQRKSWQVDGVRFQTCPAQLADHVTCQTCKLCTVERSCVVAFRAHGNKSRKVSETVASL
jgi:hypothetical protein